MYKQLSNKGEIISNNGIEVGLMQTEIPGKPEAWLYWMEGQSLTSQRGWRFGTKDQAIAQVNIWLIGSSIVNLHERQEKMNYLSSQGFWDEVKRVTAEDDGSGVL
jgi:hypothetical protein